MPQNSLNSGQVSKRSVCIICSSTVEDIISLGFHSFADSFIPIGSANLVEPVIPLLCQLCQTCGHVQSGFATDPISRYNFVPYSYTSANSTFSRSHWTEFSNFVESFSANPKLETLLEVGSNDGYLLSLLKQIGFSVLGIDASVDLAERASQSGIPTISALFNRDVVDNVGSNSLNFVVANNVLNHADNLNEFMLAVRNSLVTGGRFIGEVPYWGSTISSLHFDQIYHEHVSYFTVRSLLNLLERFGFGIQHLSFVAYHGGSIRFVAQKDSPARTEVLHLSDQDELFKSTTYLDYCKRINLRRDQFLAIFFEQKLKRPESSVVGIGAAAKANTLLTYYGLNNSLIDFITDSSENKIGKLTPFTRIPILGDPAVRDLRDPTVIILSWNIAQQLRHRIQDLNPSTRFMSL